MSLFFHNRFEGADTFKLSPNLPHDVNEEDGARCTPRSPYSTALFSNECSYYVIGAPT
jgi:hypothetical protein